jgi:3-oxoacyl-[acyl-carrier protein] reductase
VPVAVVTGASSGIGAELVRTLRAQGWLVVGISRRPSEADEHEECDVSDRLAVEAIAGRVLDRHPQLGLLVNNAGFSARTTFVDGDPAGIEAMLRTNYLGSVWVTNAFLPGLGRGSHIVNIVSVAGEIAEGPYSASKHAQLAFSRTLTVELAPRGIAVHTIKPGLIETPGFQHRHRGRLARAVTVDPSLVVTRILGAVEHDRREITVPRWYRVFALLQGVMPATFVRGRQLVNR